MEKVANNANNNCRFCLRIFEDMEERIGITSQISDEFKNITQTEVIQKKKIFDEKKCLNSLNFNCS